MSADEKQVGGSHYADMAIQPSHYIHEHRLGWCEGNVVKYVTRHARKGGAQDLRKARHYIDLLLQWEYGEADEPTD